MIARMDHKYYEMSTWIDEEDPDGKINVANNKKIKRDQKNIRRCIKALTARIDAINTH
jgi:hypothetical protein